MRYTKVFIPLLILLVLVLPAWAQSMNPYDLTWLAFNNSGTASGGQYEVAAKLGQLDNAQQSGGDYNLEGDFIGGSSSTATPTGMPTSVATPTPVVGESTTPTPPPSSMLYLPVVRR